MPPSPLQKVLSIISGGLLVGAIVVLAVLLRLWMDGKKHYEAALVLEREAKDASLVRDQLESAARSWFPGSPYARLALRKLSLMGKSAVMKGDRAAALETFEVIRRSVLATRHLVQPNRAVLSMAVSEIGRLDEHRRDQGLALSRVTADVSPGYSIGLVVGLLLWILGALAALFLRDGRKSIYYAAGSISGLLLWLAMAAMA